MSKDAKGSIVIHTGSVAINMLVNIICLSLLKTATIDSVKTKRPYTHADVVRLRSVIERIG